MTTRATPHKPASEDKFLQLKGDGTEAVKITQDYETRNSPWNGWYVFLREEAKNVFLRQSTTNLPNIEKLTCDTKYIDFDALEGLHLNSHFLNYSQVGLQDRDYDRLRLILGQAGYWRAIKQITRWEFVDKS